MSRRAEVGFEVLALLTRGVREQCRDLPGSRRHFALELCLEAVDFGLSEGHDVGTRTRNAAQLLLGLALPELTTPAITELSLLCGGTAVRAAQRNRR